MKRYRQLIKICQELHPETILEVGTWNGRRALEMMHAANGKLYVGFDLFEDATQETDEKEKNVKGHNKVEDVRKFLRENDIRHHLFKGDSKQTLLKYLGLYGKHFIDFAFIDGGHSLETIKSDWFHVRQIVKKEGVIVFDDYYTDVPDMDLFGANQVLQGLDYTLLPQKDPVNGGGFVQMALVVN